MIPTRDEAMRLLQEAENCNPGLWGNHSRHTAHCAQKIAEACGGIDAERAYISGLLHDIGRRFGISYIRHVYDGYKYMLELGYGDIARVCLSHSFCTKDIYSYIGKIDISEAEMNELAEALQAMEYDDYDRLIQLCDSIAGGEGIMKIEDRMNDVKSRYGSYPEDEWNKNLELKDYFERLAGRSVYEIVL